MNDTTRIRGYFYYEGTKLVQLETPQPIVEECETCDGDGFCECCGEDCRDCDGHGVCVDEVISVEKLKRAYPEMYQIMLPDIQAIDIQRRFLERRYGKQEVKTVRDFWVTD
jgi:hypothetical protein